MSIQRQNRKHRGNALILVVGILVLLVLVATAFITKTQSGRVTAIAQRDSALIADRADMIHRKIADEVAIALFPRIIANTFEASENSANRRRAAASLYTPRYGLDPNYPFNFAPYAVVPWTNPPDPFTFQGNPLYDILGIPVLGPENPWGGPSFGDTRWLRDTEPQRADVIDIIGQGIPTWSFTDGTPETFTHWRHLTNLSRSGNAWRIVKDISNVTGNGLSNTVPPVVSNLDIPIEQWPIVQPQRDYGWEGTGISDLDGFPMYPALNPEPLTPDGLDGLGGLENFNLWQNWLTMTGWADAQVDSTLLPQNFLDLSDLNGDGIHNDPRFGERPSDAFIRRTNRWHTEKWITDTDGDGFTDALWHLFPQNVGPDTKQVIAISVTDNSALGNMNVATQFQRSDYYLSNDYHGESTKGHTPADLAIVGQNEGPIASWRVGFMDNLANSPGSEMIPLGQEWISYYQIGTNAGVEMNWDPLQWRVDNASLLAELGIELATAVPNPVFGDGNGINNLNPTDDVYSRYGRMWYWQLAGRKPFEATDGLRPFTIADELELRIAEGNNYQFIGSRFERAVNSIITNDDSQFLRSNFSSRHEASEYRDQLDNRQLLYDNRRKLTMFSGARNDLLPPWLRWEDRFWNRHDPQGLGIPTGYDSFDIGTYEAAGVPAAIRPAVYGSTFPMKISIEGINAAIANGQEGLEAAVRNWREQSRTKLDLREYYPGEFLFPDPNEEYWWESKMDGRLTFAERLPLQLLLAMTDGQEQGVSSIDLSGQAANAPLGTYLAPDPDGSWDAIDTNYYQQARLAAAGLASNILTYRDEDSTWRQHSVLPYTFNSTERMKDLPLSQAVTPPLIGRQSNDSEDPIWGTYVPFADAHVAGPNEPTVEMLGLEAQPFILEAFIAHSHQAKDGGLHWACCLETGGCEDVSKDTCEGLLGGTFFDGFFCDPNGDGNLDDSPCPDQGACCLDSGGCLFTSQVECDEMDATYQGDGVSCIDEPCFGACCVDGTDNSGDARCIDISASSCGELGAAFAGFGTECATTTCTLLGACCFESASCMDTLSESHCNSLGGTFDFGVFCDTNPCLLGACCLALEYGACVEVTRDTCEDLLGTYTDTGDLCISNPCTNTGACCMPSGSCMDVMLGNACVAHGGIFIPGAACIDGSLLTSSSTPIADTWIRESAPTTAFGTQTNIISGEEPGSNRAHVLIDFLIDDVIESGNVVDATIVLDYEQFSGVNSTVTIARLAQTWDNDSATWNTHDGAIAWPNGAGAFGDADETIEVETYTVGTSGDVKIHVEQFVLDAIENRDRLMSLIMYKTIADGAESNTQFASSDTKTGTEPTLTIQYVIGIGPCASACCLSVDVCETVSQDTCDVLGGTFTSGVTCADGACEGACCFATGGCEVLSQESCEEEFSATYSGPGTTCSAEECGIEGACCLEYIPDEIWLNELLYDNSPVWVNEFQYDSVDTVWLNELHYDNSINPWINEFQYDSVDTAWLNELHYDNTGADVNEFIEIALDSFIDPSTVDLLLYNGGDGTVYDTLDVGTFDVGSVEGGITLYSLVLPLDGLQDGPDGVAIVIGGVLEQFVSYEGTFFATDGAANTIKSIDYGVSETALTPVGASIGLEGTGSNYADFAPTTFDPDSRGLINAGQQIDEGELIEIAIDTEIDPATTTVEISLYNGGDGTVYDTLDVSTFTVVTTIAGHKLYSTLTSLQDDNDGIAITVSGVLQQFISYEGAFLATAGPATGFVSENIPVTQSNADATASLGLTGTGTQYSEFTWSNLDPLTVGLVNTGQTIEGQGEFIEIALDKYIDPSDVTGCTKDSADCDHNDK